MFTWFYELQCLQDLMSQCRRVTLVSSPRAHEDCSDASFGQLLHVIRTDGNIDDLVVSADAAHVAARRCSLQGLYSLRRHRLIGIGICQTGHHKYTIQYEKTRSVRIIILADVHDVSISISCSRRPFDDIIGVQFCLVCQVLGMSLELVIVLMIFEK